MRSELTCAEAEESGFPERYAAGTLDDESLERFESHFLLCARCQEAIAMASTVRRAARRTRVKRVRRIHYLSGAAALLAALAGAAVLHLGRVDAIRALGHLATAPAYGGVPVRGEASADDSVFAAAMDDYAAGHYERAARELRALLDGGPVPVPVPVSFFLGASLLMTRDATAAADAFARTIAAGDTPYRNDAHYYRALALLQADRPDSAEVELRAAARAIGATGDSARALLQRLKARGMR